MADQQLDELMAAAARGNVATVQRLVADGVDVNDNSSGFSALHVAAKEGNADVVTALLDAGADVNIGGMSMFGGAGPTPLDLALGGPAGAPCVELLRSHGGRQRGEL